MTKQERTLLDDLKDAGREIIEKLDEALTGRKRPKPVPVPIPVRNDQPRPRSHQDNNHYGY